MSQLYCNSGIQLRLDTTIALGAASNTKILWQDPEGLTGAWTATVSGTELVYDVVETDINVEGNWRLQAYVEIASVPRHGDIITQNFKTPINQIV